MLTTLRGLIPRSTWAYGEDLCDGLFNIETVFLHQNDVIDMGTEDCHHLTVCVVGPGAAGKTSLIRKLTDEPFQSEHRPTELMDTSTIQPALLSNTAVEVTEQYIQVRDWRKVEEKTDTDELIAHRVASTLNQTTIKEKGSLLGYFLRVLAMNFLVLFTCICSTVHGAQPLASICLSVIYGFVCLGRNDTAMRMSLGSATLVSIIVIFAAERLAAVSHDGYCELSDYLQAMIPICAVSALWGAVTGIGMNPGVASGLAIVNMAAWKDEKASIMDQIYPGTSNTFLFQHIKPFVLRYWMIVGAVGIIGFAINTKIRRWSPIVIACLCTVVCAWSLTLGGCFLSLQVAFPLTVFICYIVGTWSLPFGRNMAKKKEPVGLERIDLVNSLARVHGAGVLIGVLAGITLLHGEIVWDSINDCFLIIAILVLIFILSKSSPIYQYFAASPHRRHVVSRDKDKDDVRSQRKLHRCFKLLVRDFAGQMEYHCMHQPFLPRYGVFICTFSWRKAGQVSLKYAERRNNPEDGPDECLEEILFWLKNILMHRRHPPINTGTPYQKTDVMDQENIKNIFLVATHSHFDSCHLNEKQKRTIMDYYRLAFRRHKDINNSIEFDVSPTGEISIENRDGFDDQGISILKNFLIKTSERVVNCCFKEELPVYFWCWLKEKRDKCVETDSPPCELMYRSHIDIDGRYMSVYPKDTFHDMIDRFCNIGEIFLVMTENDEETRASTDYYIFFDVQFLLDFMKEIVSINEKKEADRLKGEEWLRLRREGRGRNDLLEHQLKKFYGDRKMEQQYKHLPLEKRPLVKSMVQLDFLFFVDDDFYLPQLLPKYDKDSRHPDYFANVEDILWERVFDFQDFDFHHQYVFFRLLAKCTKHHCCRKRQVCCNWASFTVENNEPQPRHRDDGASEQWFTLSCEKRGEDGGLHNRIYLRTSADYDHKQSLVLWKNVADAIGQITKSFAKLGGKVTEFFNCPNRLELTKTHKVPATTNGRLHCGAGCKNNRKTHLVRIDPDDLPYLAVSDEVKDWLCAEMDDERFNCLLSLLLNINITYVKQQFTQPDKTREEVKTELLQSWTSSYDASLNALCQALSKLEYPDIMSKLTSGFPG